MPHSYYKSAILLFVFVWSISLLCVFVFWDASWDGRAYHQIAIYYLANGWNPIYQNMSDLSQLNDFLSHEIWVENYLKFSEIIAANFYLVFNDIESGKAINHLLAFGAFFYICSVLNKFISSIKSIILAIFICLNPIIMAQIHTYCVDGLLGCGLILLFFSIIDFEKSKSKQALIIFALSLIMLANIKLTGLAYAGIIGLIYFGYIIIRAIATKSNIINMAQPIFISGIIAVFFIALSGINPYLTNYQQDRHLGYPLLGENKIDIITGNSPKNFKDKDRFTKMALSIFSKTENVMGENTTKLRIPFTQFPFTQYRIKSAFGSDMRIGGFGYLFSGVLLLSIAFSVMLFRKLDSVDRQKMLLSYGLILISTFINPEAWWARYAPQFYLLLFIPLFFAFKENLYKKFSIAFLLIMFVNIIPIILNDSKLGLSYKQHHINSIKLLKQQEPLYIFMDNMEKSYLIKLNKYNIKYKLVDLEIYQKNIDKFQPIDWRLTPTFVSRSF